MIANMMSRTEATDAQVRKLYVAAAIHGFAIIFNFLYTAYLGFNHVPTTTLELSLDGVTGVVQLAAITYFFYVHSIIKRDIRKKQEEARKTAENI